MNKLLAKTIILLMAITMMSCDELTGYEKQLAHSEEWPQKIEGSFYLLDADEGNGKYASWAIGTFEPKGTGESILVEFRGDVLKLAGIDLEFEHPDPMVILVNQPIKMYFQVDKIEIAER